jgi:hypothetical protein
MHKVDRLCCTLKTVRSQYYHQSKQEHHHMIRVVIGKRQRQYVIQF